MQKYKVNLDTAKDENWFHPQKGRTVNIAQIAGTMTDEEAEMFYKGGCKAISPIEADKKKEETK